MRLTNPSLLAVGLMTSAQASSIRRAVLVPESPSLLPRLAPPVTRNITLHATITPPPYTQYVDGSFQGFSIEFAYLSDYAGTLAAPNKLSSTVLQNLKTLSGAPTYIRVGGSSCNRAVYDPTLTSSPGIVVGWPYPGADQPNRVTIGPRFFEALQTFPAGTQWLYCLNYADNSTAGVNRVIENGQGAVKALGKANLYAFELGNEMTGWGCKLKPCGWDTPMYAADHLNWTSLVAPKIFSVGGGEVAGGWEPRFQAGPWPGSGAALSNPRWNATWALQSGIDKDGRVRSFGPHDYMGAACPTASKIADLSILFDHDNTAKRVYPHAVDATGAVARGVSYVLGETNSISCQGREGASNVFGSALWMVDYQLYTATTNISRMYFHQGTWFRYSAWQPIAVNATAAGPRPMYYGMLLMAKLFSGGKKQVRVLTQEKHLTTYGVYSSGKLSDLVMVNLDMYNATEASTRARPVVNFKLDQAGSGSVVRRLTAAGAEVKTGITLAGGTVGADGVLKGWDSKVEKVVGGTVAVQASEVVVVTL